MEIRSKTKHISEEVPWNFIIVTCMSFDLDTSAFENYLKFIFPELRNMNAWIIRNAGGRVTDDVIRSIIIATRCLGSKYCFIIHHTCCGIYRTLTNDDIYQALEINLGPCTSLLPDQCKYDPYNRDIQGFAKNIDFHPYQDLVRSIDEYIENLKTHPLISRHLHVYGYIYDEFTDKLYPYMDPQVPDLRCSPGTDR